MHGSCICVVYGLCMVLYQVGVARVVQLPTACVFHWLPGITLLWIVCSGDTNFTGHYLTIILFIARVSCAEATYYVSMFTET